MRIMGCKLTPSETNNISVDTNAINTLVMEMGGSRNRIIRQNAEMKESANQYKAKHISENGSAYKRVNIVASYKVNAICDKFKSLSEVVEYYAAQNVSIDAAAVSRIGGEQ